MNRPCIGSIIILDGERMAGILNEREVLQHLVAHGKSPKETLVSEVMTKEAEMIIWQTTVEEAIRAMAVHCFILKLFLR